MLWFYSFRNPPLLHIVLPFSITLDLHASSIVPPQKKIVVCSMHSSTGSTAPNAFFRIGVEETGGFSTLS